jgi:hypothetical protein
MIDKITFTPGTTTAFTALDMDAPTGTVTGKIFFDKSGSDGTPLAVKNGATFTDGSYISNLHRVTTNVTSVGSAAVKNLADQRLSCLEGTMEECLINLTTFELRYEVYEGLRQMYAEQPLIIPTNILQYARFSGQPGASPTDTTFHATLSQALENCDSVFILVPKNVNQTTCFYQPYLSSVRLSLGGFGIHPANYVSTFNDPRFIAMVLDSLNLETSEITAMNYDVARSLSSPKPYFQGDGVGAPTQAWNKMYGDDSNFFIGISLSQVGF